MENGNQRLGSIYHGITLLAYCGGGAYGEVYYGKDVTGRAFAVKIVMKSRIGDHWERELKGVINYRKVTENAPDLLKIFHVEEDAESFFYTMEPADSFSETEYVPDTLAARLAHGPLPQGDMFRILSGIFSGLRTIHDAGFAHRDIKPDNILFVKGIPKLGDIGLLSSLSGTVTQLAGTLEFMPPEMRLQDSSFTDRASRQKSDLYAFGKVIYCAVTGQNAHSWPAVPKDQPFTLPLKFFLRLSFQLCNTDSARRLVSVADTAKEFAEIERKLLYGETIRDKFSYLLHELYAGFRSSLIHSGQWLRRFWGIVLILLALAGAGIWLMRPPEPFDIASVRNKQFVSKDGGFEFTIPVGWEAVTAQTIRKERAEREALKREPTEKEKKREMLYDLMLKQNVGMIFCDYDPVFADNLVFQILPQEKKRFYDMEDDHLRLQLMRVLTSALDGQAEIYEIRRLALCGLPCLYIDYSTQYGKHRTWHYLFEFEDRSVAIVMTVKAKNIARRKAEFDSVLKTLKIKKKL